MKEKLINLSKNLRFYFVIVSIASLYLLARYSKLEDQHNQTLKENLYQKQVIDSLNSEIFVKDISIGSYEVMWSILKEKDPELAEKIDLMVE